MAPSSPISPPRSVASTRRATIGATALFDLYVGYNSARSRALICGTLGESWAGTMDCRRRRRMTIALAFYLYASPMLRRTRCTRPSAGLDKKPLDRNEWRAILALIALFLRPRFLAAYEQQGNTSVWASDHTDRTIDLIVWHAESGDWFSL